MVALSDYSINPILLEKREGRVAFTRNDPLAFALLYLPHHLTNESGEITLSEFHYGLLEYAKSWVEPLTSPAAFRDCFIAPRNAGKSTWLFMVLPMWAAAHGHQQFVAAYSDSATQAEQHLQSFKMELETNMKLRNDFPELCETMKGTNVSRNLADNRGQTIRANGFVFQARGMDSSILGAKTGKLRPTLIIMDDIEPGESNYSQYLARQRLTTLLDDVLPLNVFARVAIVGTTTMPGSIIDQIRRVDELTRQYEGEPENFLEFVEKDLRWVLDENFKVHYWPAIMTAEDGVERSVWPERWSMEYLNSIRHTRSFAKNMMNRPISLDSGYWSEEDIQVGSPEEFVRTIISVDPAVTTAKTSDYTGISVLSRGNDGKIYIRYASKVKMGPTALKDYVVDLIERFDARVVYVETNQGGDLWRQVFSGIPAKYRHIRQTEKKEVRAGRAFDFYQKGKVLHTATFPEAEEQMLAFPKTPHDDIVDAITSGVLYFLGGKSNSVSALQVQYAHI